jgi:hypothetical protein
VPGTPPITDTILKKIQNCDIFVPDVTFVASTAGGKLVPNPNVMACVLGADLPVMWL